MAQRVPDGRWELQLLGIALHGYSITVSKSNSNFVLQRRLQKELMTLVKEPPDGMTIDKDTLEGRDLMR